MRTLMLCLALPLAAAGDEVVLKAGGKVSGVAEERGDKVFVRTEHGVLAFERAQVLRIDRAKSSPLQEYQERYAAADLSKAVDVQGLLAWAEGKRMPDAVRELRDRLCRLKWDALNHADPGAAAAFAAWARSNGCKEQAELGLRASIALQRARAKTADELYRLGLWAKANGMAADALVLFQETIAGEADHEHARRELGFQKIDGVWRTEREVKIAKGLVEFEGDWMTPQAKEGILLARTLEVERKRVEEERRKLETARVDARHEYERQRGDLERREEKLARLLEEIQRRESALNNGPLPCGRPGCGIGVVHRH